MRLLTPLLLVLAAPLAGAQVPTAGDSAPVTIAVTGQGQHSVPADELIVQLAVDTRARTASRAGADNADRMTAVQKALREIGLTQDEISTAFYTIRFDYGPQMRDTQYVATNSVRVDTRRLELVSRIIDTALQSGATTVAGVQYTLRDSRDATRQALTDAVADAKLQAEAVAAAAGGRLGDLLGLEAQPNRPGPIPYGQFALASGGMARAETPISPRDITVTAIVTARWRFVASR